MEISTEILLAFNGACNLLLVFWLIWYIIYNLDDDNRYIIPAFILILAGSFYVLGALTIMYTWELK